MNLKGVPPAASAHRATVGSQDWNALFLFFVSMAFPQELTSLVNDKLNAALLLLDLFEDEGDKESLRLAKRSMLEAFHAVYFAGQPGSEVPSFEDWLAQ